MFLTVLAATVLIPASAGGLIIASGFRRTSLALKMGGVIAPAAVVFATSYLYFGHADGEIRAAGDRVCGAFGAVSFIVTAGGTLLELVLSSILFTAFALAYRAKGKQVGTTS